jgi:hypothetical protein
MPSMSMPQAVHSANAYNYDWDILPILFFMLLLILFLGGFYWERYGKR